MVGLFVAVPKKLLIETLAQILFPPTLSSPFFLLCALPAFEGRRQPQFIVLNLCRDNVPRARCGERRRILELEDGLNNWGPCSEPIKEFRATIRVRCRCLLCFSMANRLPPRSASISRLPFDPVHVSLSLALSSTLLLCGTRDRTKTAYLSRSGERDREIQACVEGWCRKDRNGNTRRFRVRVSIRTSKSLVLFPLATVPASRRHRRNEL